ncbi:hypothetical protein BerOc1_01556 [Pseudodesulfovibrio hydrargyri]|uniref:Uncharacterized protein n=1 Tax=Pseudodesulfovibrio hydrargyri TaxID=2125990 RepID=A0A1J5N8L4_9BACT|nr:hypothetical protein [Pseudodesulfovibrio hydrargyri]OIQ49631.1 hypothetical protein BerOc1_01556 [Pseudodesulfovibrio hydrargyri]
MNISGDLTSSPVGFLDQVTKAREARDEGISKDSFVSIAAEEERLRQEARPGSAGIPGGMSEEDKSKIEMLKSRAEAIAAQGENGLTSGQEAEIRDIQKQISKISKMPMGENLVEKAKDQSEAKKTEKQAFGDQDDPANNGRGGMMPEDPDRLDMADQPGNRMLRQNAFVTSVKTAGAGLGASGFKSKS